MPRRLQAIVALIGLSATGMVAFSGPAPAQALLAPAQALPAPAQALPAPALAGLSHVPVCPAVPAGAAPSARCNARIVIDGSGKPLATTSYSNGYQPSALASAYRYPLPSTGTPWAWNGQTVAIVDAYRNPNAAVDLSVYRTQFGLPACTLSSGCFQEVNQNGAASPLPAGNTGWGQEISLDLDMVSAVCPMCRVLLVDASSTSLGDLGTAVNAAATLGANAISNSYGTSGEFSSEASYGDAYYNNHPGIAITASSGDAGYGVEFPAVSRNVIGVGGTSLTPSTATTRGWSETVWSGTGSGCSAHIAQQSWQQSLFALQGLTGCTRRVVADVAAVADPNTGVAVYDSYGSTGGSNWFVFGGTSVASPIISSVYALANASGSGSVAPSYLYGHAAQLFDITSGHNGNCRGSFLCTARVGYDGPTGLGTPNGLTAF